jgi:hypothetical protein
LSTDEVRQRNLVVQVGGAAMAWPLAVVAQQPAPVANET